MDLPNDPHPRPPPQPIPIERRHHVYWDPTNELIMNEEKTLLCPICKKPYQGNRILQCHDGHHFCSICACSNARICPNPMCRLTISTIRPNRNLHLENTIGEHPNILEMTQVTTQFPPVRLAADEDADTTNANPTNGIVGRCQHCMTELYACGARFKCLRCRECNICQKCASSEGRHPPKHPLILIMTPAQSIQADDLIAAAVQPKHKRRPKANLVNRN